LSAFIWPDNQTVCCWQARRLPSTGQTTRQFAVNRPDNQTTRQFAVDGPDNQTTRQFAVDRPDNQTICCRRARRLPSTGPTNRQPDKLLSTGPTSAVDGPDKPTTRQFAAVWLPTKAGIDYVAVTCINNCLNFSKFLEIFNTLPNRSFEIKETSRITFLCFLFKYLHLKKLLESLLFVFRSNVCI
jgi:hypothetical protein